MAWTCIDGVERPCKGRGDTLKPRRAYSMTEIAVAIGISRQTLWIYLKSYSGKSIRRMTLGELVDFINEMRSVYGKTGVVNKTPDIS